MNSGEIYVQGMIISRTPIYKMISCYSERCINNECGYLKEHQFEQPRSSIKSRRCPDCRNEYTTLFDIKFLNATTIELQDIEKFNEIERLSVILFDNDTIDINIGEKVIVNGELHVEDIQKKEN